MKFFGRRGRSRSVDRAAKIKRQEQASRNNDNRKKNVCDDSVGSDLPTLDQFEIAVPSKSFASEADFAAPESREDDGDNRSCTDISSITSVSYRAGYYYLRNIKNKTPEKQQRSGCLPSCSCALCMPCSCSWFTCCCCSEAKSELAATAAAESSKPTMLPHSHMREKARRAQSPGRRPIPSSNHPVHGSPGYPHYQGSGHRRSGSSSNRRFPAPAEQTKMDQISPMAEYDSIKRNHSLFDELSEDDDRKVHAVQRRKQPQQSQKKSKQKAWLRGRAVPSGGPTSYGAQHDYTSRDKSNRSRSRGRSRPV